MKTSCLKTSLGICLAASQFLVACPTIQAADVGGLRCEFRCDPLGIDVVKPRLSWVITSDRRGERQTAYQVLAASSLQLLDRHNGDLWDSGKTSSDSPLNAEYAGSSLLSRQACFWKVRIWDRDDKPTAWSPVAKWSMGLLNATDWQAQWISDAALADPAIVHLPATGPETVRESGKSATRTQGVKWLAQQGEESLFCVEPGSYHFVVEK